MGEWRLQRGGDTGPIVAKYDMSLGAPFEEVGGVLQIDKPLAFMPRVFVDDTDGTVNSITVSFLVHDGTSYVEVPRELVATKVGSPVVGLTADNQPGCPGDGGETSRIEEMATDTWTPSANFVLGTPGQGECQVTAVYVSYFVMGTLYQFLWGEA